MIHAIRGVYRPYLICAIRTSQGDRGAEMTNDQTAQPRACPYLQHLKREGGEGRAMY